MSRSWPERSLNCIVIWLKVALVITVSETRFNRSSILLESTRRIEPASFAAFLASSEVAELVFAGAGATGVAAGATGATFCGAATDAAGATAATTGTATGAAGAAFCGAAATGDEPEPKFEISVTLASRLTSGKIQDFLIDSATCLDPI